ncbi:MAG: RNA polymerase sigma factor [Isosphaeraceae bacterium]
MTSGSTRSAARPLETLFQLGTIGNRSDAELIERFLAERGETAEAAFAAVVERHGPMVLRVCRRVLADPNDAEDAFQATFFVLARKARSIARRGLLANWLYGVAVRSAFEVRKSAARRRAREELRPEMIRHAQAPTDDAEEIRLGIDEELCRLPDSFRAPVVLCDLEGKTHREAAAILGLPVGTVSSRLVRARDRLRVRLARRGLDPSAADPSRDSTPIVVPPALVAATSRAAVRLAAGAPIAGAVSVHLATITNGVLKTMMIARLTSKTVLVGAVLGLVFGAASVGVVTLAPRDADAEPFAFNRPSEREWAWIDRLTNADEATRERLKRCASAATSNFASLHRLTFDYDVQTEAPRLPLDANGHLKGVDRGFARGTVYWKEGMARYDHYPLGKIDENGKKAVYRRPRVFSVVRTREMLAYTHSDPTWGLQLIVEKPPASADEWENQRPFTPETHLDPWLHYAVPFCQDRAMLRDFCEHCRTIESEDMSGQVLLRFLRAGGGGRTEITCDPTADWLPVRFRAGQVQNGDWKVFVELTSEWRKLSGIWYPVHQVKTSYVGVDMTPVTEYDLTVRNLRANGALNLPDSAFTLSVMAIPEGTHGLDRRSDPPRSLIRSGGVVRDQRPGEGPTMRNDEQQRVEKAKGEETIPAGKSAGPTSAAPTAKSTAARREYLSLLEEYDPQRRSRERQLLDAKTPSRRRETYLAVARLDRDFAPRFLELARRHPDDPVAIDELAWLVASPYDPPESHQAAEILIRDHLASDRMIGIYRQLAIRLDPGRATAAERLLRAAAEKSPTGDFSLDATTNRPERAKQISPGPRPGEPTAPLEEAL